MIDSDKKLFKQTLDTMCDSYSQSRFDKDTLKAWYEELIDYPIEKLVAKIDLFCEENNRPPTLKELEYKHEVTIIPKNVTPLTIENNKKHMEEVKQDIGNMKSKTGKEWARKILNSPKLYPQIAVNFAKKALNMEEV